MAQDVKYKISLEDKFSSPMRRANDSVSSFDEKVVSTNKSTSSFIKKLGLITAGVIAIKKAFDLSKKAFTLGADMEQTEIAFGTFLRSAEKGKQVIAELNEFANVTPFDNDEIIKTGRVLLAAGIPAEKLTGRLKTLGDIAAGTNVPITDLGNIYSKAMNKGKLQAEELNQLAERGIPIIEVLSKEFGVTKQEVFDLGSKGKITSDVMNKAFNRMTEKGGIFFNLMEKQSKSASGLFSTLQGKVKLVGVEIGKRMLPAQKNLVKNTISLVDKINQWVKIPVAEEIQKEQKQINLLVAQLTSANTSEEKRKEILDEIKNINPKVTEGIDRENISTERLVKNLQAYNEEAVKRIVVSNLEEKETKQLIKVAKKREKLLNNELMALEAITDFDKNIAFSDKLTTDEKIKTAKNRLNQILKEQEATGKLGSIYVDASSAIGGTVDTRTKEQKVLAKLNIAQANIIENQKSLNKEENKGLDLSKRVEAAKKLLGITDKVSTTPITAQVTGLDKVEDQVTRITSAAPKTFNININNLVEEFNINSQTVTEGASEAKNIVVEELTKAVIDVQARAS